MIRPSVAPSELASSSGGAQQPTPGTGSKQTEAIRNKGRDTLLAQLTVSHIRGQLSPHRNGLLYHAATKLYRNVMSTPSMQLLHL